MGERGGIRGRRRSAKRVKGTRRVRTRKSRAREGRMRREEERLKWRGRRGSLGRGRHRSGARRGWMGDRKERE